MGEDSEAKPKRNDYDGIAKYYLDRLSDTEIIKVVKTAFKKDYPPDDRVTRLNVEMHGSGDIKNSDKNVSDYFIMVQDDMYHFEFQTTPDGEIAFRIFNYGVKGASVHNRKDGKDSVLIKLPNPMVFYLKDTKNTPKELEIGLSLPNISKIDRETNTVYYKVPVIRRRDITEAKKLKEMYLPFVLPLYTIKYIGNVTEKTVGQFLRDHKDAIDTAIEMYKSKMITLDMAKNIINNLLRVAEETVEKSDLTDKEGVLKMINAEDVYLDEGKVFVDYPLFVKYVEQLEDEKAQWGQKEAQFKKRISKAIISSIEHGINYDVICDDYELTKEEFYNIIETELKAGRIDDNFIKNIMGKN
jgi:hypothetical protein